MLLLLLRVARDRFALPARQVVEVLPDVALQSATGLGTGCAGLLAYRGGAVPVLDLGRRLAGRPCRRRLSTRLVLVRGEDEALWGLRAEGVTGTLRSRLTGREGGPLAGTVLTPEGAVRLLDLDSLLEGVGGAAAREVVGGRAT